MRAYSATTGVSYDNMTELLAAESNGWVVVGVTDDPNTAPWCTGPWTTKRAAVNAARRMRNKIKRLDRDLGIERDSRVMLRYLWKDI